MRCLLMWMLVATATLGRPLLQARRAGFPGTVRSISMSSTSVERPVLRDLYSSSEQQLTVLQPQYSVQYSVGAGSENAARSIYSIEVVDKRGQPALNAHLGHKTSGPVPRPYNPTVLLLEPHSLSTQQQGTDAQAVHAVTEEALRWYLDAGGRIGKLAVAVPKASIGIAAALELMGFASVGESLPSMGCSSKASAALSSFAPQGSAYFTSDGRALLAFIAAKAASLKSPSAAESFTLHDLEGRLHHDLGAPKLSIAPYTAALQANPSSAAAFRNLGSAYHAAGNTQLAFASYQQAIQLDAKDALVYLKLALFYEDFATKDWVDAADHALRCYAYYLDNVDPADTAVLTRMGNLQVREHRSEEAIKAYSTALEQDPSLSNVWFNRAHAEVKCGDTVAARESLRRTLALDPSITAASYMLKALSEDESRLVKQGDEKYIKELFDAYASTYDTHGKKLLYSAPRVIRQELASIYRGRFTISNEEEKIPMNLPSEQPGCTTIIPTIAINSTLDVLDLGCGTGLAGAWLKDYARSLSGVDLSEQMVAVARKKMLYQNLSVMSINAYMGQCKREFDLVVAADVLSYIGDLRETFEQMVPVTRPGGHVVFTVEAIENNKDAPSNASSDSKGYALLKSGRFGYSRSYVDALVQEWADKGKWRTVVNREFSPRLDEGVAVPGYLYVLERLGR